MPPLSLQPPAQLTGRNGHPLWHIGVYVLAPVGGGVRLLMCSSCSKSSLAFLGEEKREEAGLLGSKMWQGSAVWWCGYGRWSSRKAWLGLAGIEDRSVAKLVVLGGCRAWSGGDMPLAEMQNSGEVTGGKQLSSVCSRKFWVPGDPRGAVGHTGWTGTAAGGSWLGYPCGGGQQRPGLGPQAQTPLEVSERRSSYQTDKPDCRRYQPACDKSCQHYTGCRCVLGGPLGTLGLSQGDG